MQQSKMIFFNFWAIIGLCHAADNRTDGFCEEFDMEENRMFKYSINLRGGKGITGTVKLISSWLCSICNKER